MKNVFSTQRVFKDFKDSLDKNQLSHAYLLLSPDELSNNMIAKYLSLLTLCKENTACENCPSCQKALVGTHPDILTYPKNSNFVVEDANDINEKALEYPMLGSRKIIIINNIDEATVQAQNKILKTLEEPPKSVIFFLTAKNQNKILPTIISRIRKETLSPFDKENINEFLQQHSSLFQNEIPFDCLSHKTFKQIADSLEFGGGWLGKTIQCLSDPNFPEEEKLAKEIALSLKSSKDIPAYSSKILSVKENITTILELLEQEFRNLMLNSEDIYSQEGYLTIIEAINHSSEELERNVNPALIIDNLFMKILEIKYIYKML